MIDFSSAPRARLVTAFGTVLHVDTASGELRHGAIETNPANAFFVADQSASRPYRRGFLVHDSGETFQPIFCGADRSHCVSRPDGGGGSISPTPLELVPLERGLIAFTAANLFLCAIPDGRVSLSGPRCSTWELFLASEDWCSQAPTADAAQVIDITAANLDKKRIENHIVHPLTRVAANTKPKAKKVLIYGYTKWSHGRVYYDLCKYLHRRGYIVDILDWQVNHADYIKQILPYYDLFMTALDGVRTLVDVYGVPYERVIAVSHHELDIRMLIEQKGMDVFDKFGNYGVVSEYLYCASLMRGVTRAPKVASLGINYSEFHADIPERLATVGYASSMSVKTYGVEWKRGELAEAAVRDAGLAFKVAGWTGNQISFHDMPDFYKSVDAVLTSSISEAAQLPVMEAAAAGRLVIGTPVGHFPLKAYQGGGIIAPIEAGKFKAFAAATLRYYKENPSAYVDKCHAIQTAARKFDWQYSIEEWVDLIEEASSPNNLFERARSLQTNGKPADAARFFSLVANAGGDHDTDDELAWCARWQESRCYRDLGDDEGFVRTAQAAFRKRPHRAEPLHDLAHYHLSKSHAVPAAYHAEAALALPKPAHDKLLVDETLYESGLRHTFAATASWSPDAEQRDRGHKVCEWLALDRDVPTYIRGPARYNLSWYAAPAQLLLPSLQLHPLVITAPAGFHAANLSICRAGDRLIVMVRAVNWKLLTDRPGYNWAYLPGHSSGESKLLLLEFNHNLDVIGTHSVHLPDDMPEPQYREDLGFADPRPFMWRGELWCLCLVRQFNPTGRSEMVLSRVKMPRPNHYVLSDWRQLPSGQPPREEKNWMPQVIGDALRFIYSTDPTRIITDTGDVLGSQPAAIAGDSFRGGSQAVPFDGGWLMLIHEVELINTKRNYFHRFIWMDATHTLRRISRRFYFRVREIEFAAGMTWHPDDERLIISFSVNDNDQYLAVVTAHDVRAALCEIRQIEHANAEVTRAAAVALDRVKIEMGFGSVTGATAFIGPIPKNANTATQISGAKDQLSVNRVHQSKKGIICDIDWLSGYICHEHYYLIMLLQSQYGFDIINSKKTDLRSAEIIENLNTYDALLIAYQGYVDIPIEQLSCYKIFRIDDLVSYDQAYDELLDRLIRNSDMIISPYAYAFHRHFQHNNVKWIPYSSAVECYSGVGFNVDPLPKVLVSGSIASDRPLRRYAADLTSENIEVLQHPGYDRYYDDNSSEIVRGRYYRELNKYICGFADAHTYRYLHLKVFEIASVGSLLLADKIIEAEMNELGFVDYETCIFTNQENLIETISWICDEKNRETVDKIRRAGMELVKERHLTRHRARQLNEIVNNAILGKNLSSEAKDVALVAPKPEPDSQTASQSLRPRTIEAQGTTVSVIIPSRLARSAGGERLFLEDAVQSIRQQQASKVRIQIIVGVDSGANASADLARRLGIEFVESGGHSQAAALNAASERAVGEFLAILEDDDSWDCSFLQTAVDALGRVEFVSSNQLQVKETGQVVDICDFPCPCSWIMRRETFKAVGGFDETYRWHLDNEWLGRLGETGRSRIHFVESTAPIEPELLEQRRLGLYNVLHFGGPAVQLMRHGNPMPLVVRRFHDGSGMHGIQRDQELKAESEREFERLRQRYGYIPH